MFYTTTDLSRLSTTLFNFNLEKDVSVKKYVYKLNNVSLWYAKKMSLSVKVLPQSQMNFRQSIRF